jgi:hypothetical protein
MIACCDYCYEKYINADDTLDKDRYIALVSKRLEKYKNTPIIVQSTLKNTENICTCLCHKDGVKLMH